MGPAFSQFRRRWRVAKYLAAAERDGRVLISVPRFIADEVRQGIWVAQVDHAASKWAERTMEVELPQWRDAMTRLAERRLPTADKTGDDHGNQTTSRPQPDGTSGPPEG